MKWLKILLGWLWGKKEDKPVIPSYYVRPVIPSYYVRVIFEDGIDDTDISNCVMCDTAEDMDKLIADHKANDDIRVILAYRSADIKDIDCGNVELLNRIYYFNKDDKDKENEQRRAL